MDDNDYWLVFALVAVGLLTWNGDAHLVVW